MTAFQWSCGYQTFDTSPLLKKSRNMFIARKSTFEKRTNQSYTCIKEFLYVAFKTCLSIKVPVKILNFCQTVFLCHFEYNLLRNIFICQRLLDHLKGEKVSRIVSQLFSITRLTLCLWPFPKCVWVARTPGGKVTKCFFLPGTRRWHLKRRWKSSVFTLHVSHLPDCFS